MSTVSRRTGSAIVELVDIECPVDAAVVSFACATGGVVLESSLQKTGYGRFSIFASHPVAAVTIKSPARPALFRALADRASEYPTGPRPNTTLPFVGGWIGFFSYEAGLATERIEPTPRDDAPLPLARFCLYDAAAVYDHYHRQWYVTAVDWPAPLARQRPAVSERLAALRSRLESAQDFPPNAPPIAGSRTLTPNMSHGAYLAKVETAKRYIEAGDIYQVNLTQRFSTRTDASPLALYQRLRRTSPSSHAAFLSWGETAILSSSPELFLDLSNGHVVTRPIKGTRPRGDDPAGDTAMKRQLVGSEKERAELNMIIDLLRNDLGRVCSFGSVRVTDAGQVEEHPTVFHRVATIEGDLEPDRTWVDLLEASFPGGSVTGVPKIRAMQIIDELEPTRRGVYCGSIGWIGLDGSMSMNIAIRTMVQIGNEVHVYAGGAIVAESTPEQEYNEILAKAAGMLRALGCEAPARSSRLHEVTIP